MPKAKDKRDRPTPDDNNGEPPHRPSGRQKYTCGECGKELAHRVSLRRHLATVHGVGKSGARLQDAEIARLRGVRQPKPLKGKRQTKASRTKPIKSVEFVESDSDVEPETAPPAETVPETQPSAEPVPESQPIKTEQQEKTVDLAADLCLSDSSFESPQGRRRRSGGWSWTSSMTHVSK